MSDGLDTGFAIRGRKRKPLDATINLVPFIDLMAIAITFLIMTAVWTQIGRLPVAQMGDDMESTADPLEREKTPVHMLIAENRVEITVGLGAHPKVIELRRNDKGQLRVEEMKTTFEEISRLFPDQNDLTLHPEDSVKYLDLVRIVDTAVGANLTAISIAPVSS